MTHEAHDLEFETKFWGDCCNTFDEEQKHYVYAKCMGLDIFRVGYGYELPPKRILDVGGGPVSLLLKCRGFTRGHVVDPIEYPDWVVQRYACHNITLNRVLGEDLEPGLWGSGFDEVWLYNVLQHTHDPNKVLQNIWGLLKPGGYFRFFEWIGIPAYEGHPHEISAEMFAALESRSASKQTETVVLGEQGCFGTAYCGWLKS